MSRLKSTRPPDQRENRGWANDQPSAAIATATTAADTAATAVLGVRTRKPGFMILPRGATRLPSPYHNPGGGQAHLSFETDDVVLLYELRASSKVTRIVVSPDSG